jgi:hypothetical protein
VLLQQENQQQQLQPQQELQHAAQQPGLLSPAPPEANDLAAPPAAADAAAAPASGESAVLNVTHQPQQQQQQQSDGMAGQPAAQDLTDRMAHIGLADTGDRPG